MKFEAFLFQSIRKCWSIFSLRYLNHSFIRFTTVTIILMGILHLVIACLTSSGGRNIYGSWAGGDYSCFYVAGKILNIYPPDKLYDFHLQSDLLHTLFPKIPLTEQLPYVNPPFFALIFIPLSALPYMVSYLAWVLISVILYILSFKLVWRTLDSLPSNVSNISILLALSFEPFIMENVLGGNSSSVAFFAFACFLYFWSIKKDLMAGFSIGILLYKPTFLIMILPMLLIARRIKIVAGFSLCSVILIFLSVQAVGVDTCMEYVRLMFGISNTIVSSENIFRMWKYVDIFSFSHLLFGTISPLGLIFIVVISSTPIIYLIKFLWNIDSLNESSQELLISTAISLTIIINLHFAIYDSMILVLSILLTADVLYRNIINQNSSEIPTGFKVLLLSIFIVPWVSQHVARTLGFQLFTIAVASVSVYQVFLASVIFQNNRIFIRNTTKVL